MMNIQVRYIHPYNDDKEAIVNITARNKDEMAIVYKDGMIEIYGTKQALIIKQIDLLDIYISEL